MLIPELRSCMLFRKSYQCYSLSHGQRLRLAPLLSPLNISFRWKLSA